MEGVEEKREERDVERRPPPRTNARATIRSLYILSVQVVEKKGKMLKKVMEMEMEIEK